MATRIPKNHARFTVAELLAATRGELCVPGSAEGATSISTDTRGLDPGAAFVALHGKAYDGHAYVEAAAAAGAAVAIVEHGVEAPPTLTVIRVASTLLALGDLARAHVQRWRASGDRTLVGITGSAGKTTTRVATAALVESLTPGQLVATRGNLNNRIGVPLMLFVLAPEHRCCIVELGTSEPGEIPELCRIAQPDVGIVTLVTAAHLDGFGSVDNVEHEKAALYRSLPIEGTAVGNGDDWRVRRSLQTTRAVRRVTFGRSAEARVRVLGREPLGMNRSRVTLVHAGGQRSALETPLVGEAGALACAAAVATVEAAFDVRFDGDWLANALARVDTRDGAQRLIPHELPSGLVVIDDSYNANPASMVSSIWTAEEMARAANRPLVLVLGEMRELASEAAQGHEAVGRVAAESGARIVFAIGGGEAFRIGRSAQEGGADVFFASTVDQGLPAVIDAVRTTDLALVKGSRSVGMDRIVAELSRCHGPRTPP